MSCCADLGVSQCGQCSHSFSLVMWSVSVSLVQGDASVSALCVLGFSHWCLVCVQLVVLVRGCGVGNDPCRQLSDATLQFVLL